MEKFICITRKILMIFFMIFLSLIIFRGTFFNGIFLSIVSFIFIYYFVNNVKIKKFSVFLVVFSLLIKISAVIFLKVPVLADYELMYNASLDFIKGDLSFTRTHYFTYFGYQLGNVLYQALILKIFNSIVVLKILNCVYASIITLLIYLLVRKFSSEKSARFVSLFYTISLYPIYLNSILGNQQLSLMLILLGIYILLVKKRTILNLCLVGLFLFLGNLERPEGIIYIMSIIIYLIFSCKLNISTLKKIFIILFVYFSLNSLASFVLIKCDINDVGFKNTNPLWKFVAGLNYEAKGKYNEGDQNNYIFDENLELEVIKERITDFKKLPFLFYEKIGIQWLYLDLDNAFNAKNSVQFSDDIVSIIVNYIKVMNFIIIFIAFIFIFNRNKSDIELFFIINFCLYFFIYLFIEVNARYYFNPQVCIIILSAYGVDKIINKCNQLCKFRKFSIKKKLNV